MPIKNKYIPLPFDQKELLDEIEQLKIELARIEKETREFEGLLRVQIGDLIVEEQELFILYKEIKKAKKC